MSDPHEARAWEIFAYFGFAWHADGDGEPVELYAILRAVEAETLEQAANDFTDRVAMDGFGLARVAAGGVRGWLRERARALAPKGEETKG